jgi:hypothetical protein
MASATSSTNSKRRSSAEAPAAVPITVSSHSAIGLPTSGARFPAKTPDGRTVSPFSRSRQERIPDLTNIATGLSGSYDNAPPVKMPDWQQRRATPPTKDTVSRGGEIPGIERLEEMTPTIDVDRLEKELNDYPFPAMAERVIDDLRNGVCFYVEPDRQPKAGELPRVHRNDVSVETASVVLGQYIEQEMAEGHLLGPFQDPLAGTESGPLKVVEQHDTSSVYVRVCRVDAPPA